MYVKLAVLAMFVSFTNCSKDDSPAPAEVIVIPEISDAEIGTDIQTDLEIDATLEVINSLQQKRENPTGQANRLLESPACNVTPTLSDELRGNDSYIGYTYNFGEGCTQSNGVVLKGKIILLATSTKDFKNIIFEFKDFSSNERIVNGTVGFKKEDFETNQAKITTVQDVTVKLPNKGEFKRKGTLTRSYLKGYDTPENINDDVFEAKGSWVTTFPDNTENVARITKDLRVTASCSKIHVGGIINFTRNKNNAEINFGDGLNCGQIWKITRNGKIIEIPVNQDK